MNETITIKVCMGTSGIAAGGAEVLSTFEEVLKEHNISAKVGMGCSLHKAGCRGLCTRDVLVDVLQNDTKVTYQFVKPEMVERVVEEHIIGGRPIEEWIAKEDYHAFFGKQLRVVLANCGEIDPENIDSYIAVGGYEAEKKAVISMTPEKIINIVKDSKLRGRGGAGFPTGLKWEACAKIHSDQKYILCNGSAAIRDVDRTLMEADPHSIIEGMVIGAKAIGASQGYIYVRTDYSLAVSRLQIAINQCYEAGLLGKNILGTGFDFDLKIFKGAGAFVCGESTALMRSIEGERGMPTPKLWRSAERGLWNRPTVLNNVETFANIPKIILKGANWFRKLGTERSGGTKVFSLTGKVKNSGLVEVPLGISLREIIYDIGGGAEDNKVVKAVQTGGPSGGCIPVELIDVEVDYEPLASAGSIMGSGSMVVLDETDCMVSVAKFFLAFTQKESCGKCTPCRIGTKRMLEILEKITSGNGVNGDIRLLEELGEKVKVTSLCGLGQTAPNPVLSTIRYFVQEYEAHINEKKCPAKVCRPLITFSVLEDLCTGCGACVRACPSGAVIGKKKRPHKIDHRLCIKCGACLDVCKFKAVKKE